MSLPYFRYFIGDQLKAKRGMTHEQKGIYVDLLEVSWDQAGTLPSDLTELARLVGLSLAQFTPHASIVLQDWRPKGKRLVHEWLQQEYAEKFAQHAERSESGGKGGRATQERLKEQKQQQLTQVTKGKLSSSLAQAQLKHPQSHIQSHIQSQSHNPKKNTSRDEQKSRALAVSAATWDSYAEAYRIRYNADPVRNKHVNSQLKKLVEVLGAAEATQVAAFYLSCLMPLYLNSRHPTNLLLRDATGLRTQWATGVRATGTKEPINSLHVSVNAKDYTKGTW